MKKKAIWYIAAAVLPVMLSITGNTLKPYILEYHKEKNLIEEIQREGINLKEKNHGKESRINFKKLKSLNPDMVAWLEIPGTVLNYPVVQANDNVYYLNHDFKKEYSPYGSVFLDARVKPPLQKSSHLIIYGHNMGGNTDIIFSALDDLYEAKKQSDVPAELYLYTEQKVYQYELLECREVEATSGVYQVRFHTTREFLAWQKTHIAKFDERRETEQILTLSTCNADGERRIVVMFRRK